MLANPFREGGARLPLPPNTLSNTSTCYMSGTIDFTAAGSSYITFNPMAAPHVSDTNNDLMPVLVGTSSAGAVTVTGALGYEQGVNGTDYDYRPWSYAPHSSQSSFGHDPTLLLYRCTVGGIRWRFIGKADNLGGRAKCAVTNNHAKLRPGDGLAEIDAQPGMANLPTSRKWQSVVWSPLNVSAGAAIYDTNAMDDYGVMETNYRDQPLDRHCCAVVFDGMEAAAGSVIEYEVWGQYEIVGAKRGRISHALWGSDDEGEYPYGRDYYRTKQAYVPQILTSPSDPAGAGPALEAAEQLSTLQGAPLREEAITRAVNASLAEDSQMVSFTDIVGKSAVKAAKYADQLAATQSGNAALRALGSASAAVGGGLLSGFGGLRHLEL